MKFIIVVCLYSLALFPVHAFAKEQILIKFSHVSAANSPKGKAANYFSRLATERTHGKVRVVVYPDSTLFKDNKEFEALQLGTVHMLAPSLSKFSSLNLPEFGVFDLPYLFDNYEEIHRVTKGPVGKMILERLKKRGIVGLTYWDNGFKSFSANRPIRLPRDFHGLDVRIQPSKVLEEMALTLKMRPRPMAFSDVRAALSSNIVNAAENPPSNFYASGIYQTQTHLSLTQHGYLGYAVIVNQKFWNNIPKHIRHQLESALADATDYANQIAEADNAQALNTLKHAKHLTIHQPNAAEHAALRKALIPVHRKLERDIGVSLLRAVYKEVDFQED